MTDPVRHYVEDHDGRRAVVSLTPSQAAFVAALRGRCPAPVPRPQRATWDALRTAGVPVVPRGRGYALAGRVERLADWCRPEPIPSPEVDEWDPFA